MAHPYTLTPSPGVRVPVVLVGNKTDLHVERMVTTEAGRRVADKWKAVFLETSAKQHEVREWSEVLMHYYKSTSDEHEVWAVFF